MSKFLWIYLIFVFASICGCDDNPSIPALVASGPQSVSFEIQLPPQGSTQEVVEMEFPIDLGVSISRLSSIRVSARGTAIAAIHSCGDCASGADLSGDSARTYFVPKQISISIESSDRLFDFSWRQEVEGNFVIAGQSMQCDLDCDTAFGDGTGVVRVSYGSGSIDTFLCFSGGSGNWPPDFCSLDSGSVIFDKNIVITVDYNNQSNADGPLWGAKKAMY